jgi:hypothetical protein
MDAHTVRAYQRSIPKAVDWLNPAVVCPKPVFVCLNVFYHAEQFALN